MTCTSAGGKVERRESAWMRVVNEMEEGSGKMVGDWMDHKDGKAEFLRKRNGGRGEGGWWMDEMGGGLSRQASRGARCQGTFTLQVQGNDRVKESCTYVHMSLVGATRLQLEAYGLISYIG